MRAQGNYIVLKNLVRFIPNLLLLYNSFVRGTDWNCAINYKSFPPQQLPNLIQTSIFKLGMLHSVKGHENKWVHWHQTWCKQNPNSRYIEYQQKAERKYRFFFNSRHDHLKTFNFLQTLMTDYGYFHKIYFTFKNTRHDKNPGINSIKPTVSYF